jgi:hypothetical protein
MNNVSKILYWAPRILCILAILFISLFAGDAFSPELSFWQQVNALFMHLIPSFVLILFLVIAWKRELIGGILFVAVGIIASPFVFYLNYHYNHFPFWQCILILLMITFPFILVGLLFILSHRRARKQLLQAN